MAALNSSLKLILAGNTNIPATINAIIQATLQARENTEKPELTFRQVHIFHTEQSLHALMKATPAWQKALEHYKISMTSFVHHVTKLEDSNIDRFRDLVEQLRTIVNPLDNAHYYIDLTNGISALKTILAVFAYVLDIEHIYSLETQFASDRNIRQEQSEMFLNELVEQGVPIKYRKFPPIQQFDTFGKLNYTEIIRHRHVVHELTNTLKVLLPQNLDLEHLRSSLLSGVNSRLLGEVTNEPYNFRHSVFSYAAGVEEIANLILTVVKDAELEKKTLGDKLAEIRALFENTSKYFIDKNTLEHLTLLITSIRNDVVHPSSHVDQNQELVALQSKLSSHLALTFLQYTIKTLGSFLDKDGNLVNVQTIEPEPDDEAIYYFGFDGDATGDYMEMGFVEGEKTEDEVLKRSQTVRAAIQAVQRRIQKELKDSRAVLFAEGDNILFKGKYNIGLLHTLQKIYQEHTNLCSSIGYGKTLHEATIAMRLAKAQAGNSILGVSLHASQPIDKR